MRLLGYPANKISILTTYNGQKFLIRDVISRRCVPYNFIGPPHKVATVDKFQGQQNDFILLSLVRSRFVGHLRDVRRLVVAMSRARLGLYVFCNRSLFEQCYELQPTFQRLLQRPDRLALNFAENMPVTDRNVEDTEPEYLVSGVEEMASIVNSRMYQVDQTRARSLLYQFGQGDSTMVNDMDVERPNLENGETRQAPPPGSNSEEGMDMEEDKIVQNGDVQVENHDEVKTDPEVLADGDVNLTATNMGE
ncbi:RNA helicase aquarius [Bienertia sinuspersici]